MTPSEIARDYETLATERFWSHVNKTDGCWLWMGGKLRRGYGSASWKAKKVSAHRLVIYLTTGEWPPKDLDVCHHCDNPPCVRPDHLFIGTRRDNMQDAVRKNRLATCGANVPFGRNLTHCKRGHEFTPANTMPNGMTSRGYLGRACRICKNTASARYHIKTKAALRGEA